MEKKKSEWFRYKNVPYEFEHLQKSNNWRTVVYIGNGRSEVCAYGFDSKGKDHKAAKSTINHMLSIA